MHDLLSKFPDPVDEAEHRFENGDKMRAKSILAPIFQDIKASGQTPSHGLQALMERIILDDAQTHGVV